VKMGSGGRMGRYPIVRIEGATVDGCGCVGDDDEGDDDRMLVHAEECGLKNTLFGTWRNVMWRMVSLVILYRSRFVSEVIWSTPTKLNLVDVLESSQASSSLVSDVWPRWRCEDRMSMEPDVLRDKNTREMADSASQLMHRFFPM